jgi:hypothetical protein
MLYSDNTYWLSFYLGDLGRIFLVPHTESEDISKETQCTLQGIRGSFLFSLFETGQLALHPLAASIAQVLLMSTLNHLQCYAS